MQIEPITHLGHSTTYTYKITRPDGRSVEINASNPSGIVVYGMPNGPHRFDLFKSALNFVLAAPN